MKKLFAAIICLVAFCTAPRAHAQIYSIVNQGTSMIQTALNGGFRYRGLVDASYNRGIGSPSAGFLEFTTTQGVKYANWFYMGIGAGVDVLFANEGNPDPSQLPSGKSFIDTACLVPLFTEFRFNIGQESAVSFYISLRVGAAFLMGKNYVMVGDGYIYANENLYFKPALGLRIPVSKSNSKQAVNVGCSYTLLSNGNYWCNTDRSVTLNSLGISVGFEW